MKTLKSLLIIFSLICFQNLVYAQQWGINTLSQFTNEANDVEINNSGESYVAGYITGQTSFSPTEIVPGVMGNGDIYIAKYSSSGTLIWQKTFGGNYSDRAIDLAVGPDQNIVVTGQYFGSVNFGNTTLSSVNNSKDIFVLKLDPQGNVLWARSEGGSMAENAYGITVDQQNNVILTGQFQGNATIGGSNFTSAVDPQTGLPSYDLFLSKYTSNGAPVWTKNGSAHYEDRGFAVATDNQNNIFFTGQFSDTLTFAGNTYNNIGYNTGFLCKLNPNGQVQFFNLMKAGLVAPYDLEINSDNEVVIIGDFLGNMNYYDAGGAHAVQNPFDKQIFIVKTNNSGAYSWNYTLGSDNELSARSVSIDPHKDIFVTGFFKCALSQIQDTANALFNSVGYRDPYLLKINNNSGFEYIRQMGGKMDDTGNGVAVTSNDRPYVCGAYTRDLNIPFNTNPVSSGMNGFGLQAFPEETGHYYLIGDSTYNSFLTTVVNHGTQQLNYFSIPTSDSLEGYITNAVNFADSDTLHTCVSGELYYNTTTFDHYGPAYYFQWQNGDTTTNNWFNYSATGNYFVTVHRFDECKVETDSVYCIVHELPHLPLLSDNLGINNLNPGNAYASLTFCDSADVTLNFSNLDPSASFYFYFNDSLFTSPGPHSFTSPGGFAVHANNQYCDTTGYFSIDVLANEDYDTIHPDIVLLTDIPTGDSITICENEPVNFHGVDLFVNPSANFNPMINQPTDQVIWYVNGQQYSYSDYLYNFVFSPETTGWYTIGIDILLGHDNQCGTDTTHYYYQENFYVQVNPLPIGSCSVSGDSLICPEGSLVLTVAPVTNGFSWNGPGIVSSPSVNSILINAAGTYTYGGILTDPLTGCSNLIYCGIEVHEKQAPHISSLPNNALICPYDSVLMYVPNVYTSYNWVGPEGDQLSNTHELYSDEMGFYYCHVTDNQGCELTTPPYELREYSTPGISVYPDAYLCVGESVEIDVNYTGDATFQWLNYNSTQDHITVSQAGVYAVQVSQCGFTVTDSITIIDGTFNASISTPDSVLCYGEQAVLLGLPAGMSYEWNNGQTSGNIYQTDQAGTYFATVTNSYGCTDQTNSITISQVPESVLPDIASLTVCPGSDVTLTDSSSFTLNWYQFADTALLTSNHVMHLTNVTESTSFLVAYQSSECAPAYATVTVSIADSLAAYQISGDFDLCQGQNGIFSIDSIPTNIDLAWYAGQISLGSANPVEVDFSTLENNPVISVQISNTCYSTNISETVNVLPQTQISLPFDSIALCYYDTEMILPNSTSSLDSILWNSFNGTVSGDEFQLSGNTNYGTVSVIAYDQNGCITNTAYLEVITPNFNHQVNLDFTNFCIGNSGTVSAETTADSLIWTTPFGQFDSTSFSFELDAVHSGVFYLDEWDNLGCHYTDSLLVPLYQNPVLNILPDSIFCLNDIYTYYFPNDTNTYSWQTFGNSTDIPILSDQNLILTATTPHGCSVSDTLVVHTVNCDDPLPNFITPNGDGNNDYFFLDDALSQQHNTLLIVNRYGNVVYEASPYQNEFGGANLTEGVYFYYYYPNGKQQPENVRQGFLHLIR